MPAGYPDAITFVRHAQSAGNVANDAAIAAGRPELDLAQRDMDVPLSASVRSRRVTWAAGSPRLPTRMWCCARPTGGRSTPRRWP